MIAYIVFAHGSSIESANDAVRDATRRAASRGGWQKFAAAFLGGGSPNLAEAAGQFAAEGATRIVVIPYFLTSGLHLERDLPALLDEIRARHPGLAIDAVRPLDGHPGLVEALVDRANDLPCAR